MKDLIKNFLEREFAEIEKNKIRIAGLIFIASAGIFFALNDFEDNEEIISSEAPQIEDKNISSEKNSEKNLPDKNISVVQKNSDKNITKVIGASSDSVSIKNPFQISEDVETEVEEAQKIPEEKNLPQSAPITISPPKKVAELVESEVFVLEGTAISENKKTALIKCYKGKDLTRTLLLKIGDNLQGKFVTEITENSITFSNGEKLYIN